jgi:hydrogenase maturation protease
LTSPDGTNVGVVVRQQQHVEGALEIDGQSIGESLFKLTVRARNTTQFEGGGRDDALCRALVSAHTILEVRSGSFVSLLDPPAQSKEAAAACANIGLFPVLVGAAGATDTLLASPIILYDYPQVAPESPTNLFDGCEIDEILTLRIMTLTDEEKQDAAAVDERTKNLLATTEALAREQLSQLHGAFRAVDGGK